MSSITCFPPTDAVTYKAAVEIMFGWQLSGEDWNKPGALDTVYNGQFRLKCLFFRVHGAGGGYGQDRLCSTITAADSGIYLNLVPSGNGYSGNRY